MCRGRGGQVRLASVAENSFNAVERINEFCALPQEAPEEISGSKPDDWPDQGRVRLKLRKECQHETASTLCVSLDLRKSFRDVRC